jgi:hypothetical protein
VTPLPLPTRLWFAFLCLFRVLFDGAFAASVWRVREAGGALPEAPPTPRLPEPVPARAAAPTLAPVAAPPAPPVPSVPSVPSAEPALQLLALLQREGRLIDFLEQDIAAFPDADIGAAARVIHDGCRKALRAHAKLAPVRSEEEGARVTLAAGFSPAEVKLSGNVQGHGPYTGVLRHRGWRATDLTLPVPVQGYEPSVLAPAEVEL